MVEFETTDIDGNVCHFQYEVEYGDILHENEVIFKVYEVPANEMEWFSYTLEIQDENTAKGINLSHNYLSQFSRKGIPEKIIEIACNTLERNIISSPISPQPGNYLVTTSKKAWERLVEQNINASRDDENDRFQLLFIN
jgi:hypothetical protein